MTRKLGLVLALTAIFTVVEIAGGLMSNSLTLIADAGHMFTDVAALVLALFGARIAQRREGAAYRFGNLRWEVLAAMVNGLMLFIIGIGITIGAIDRFRHPLPINAEMFGGVAVVGLLVNLFSLRVLHGGHRHNLNVRGAYLHIMGDTLGSVGAIVGAVLIHYTGWLKVDPIISVLVSVLILRSAWRLIRESGLILLDRLPDHVSIADVEQRLLAVPGVSRLHDLHVWKVADGLTAMSAHAVVLDLEAHPVVLRQLETGHECEGELCGDEEVTGLLAGRMGQPHVH